MAKIGQNRLKLAENRLKWPKISQSGTKIPQRYPRIGKKSPNHEIGTKIAKFGRTPPQIPECPAPGLASLADSRLRRSPACAQLAALAFLVLHSRFRVLGFFLWFRFYIYKKVSLCGPPGPRRSTFSRIILNLAEAGLEPGSQPNWY